MPTPIADTFRSFWPCSTSSAAPTYNTLAKINSLESVQRHLADSELRERVHQFMEDLEGSAPWSSPQKLYHGLSLFKEAARRVVGIRYYDVQLMATLAMTRNTVAEMATGEGKTYVGAMTAFVHALGGAGAHLMTTNAYLAERDYDIVKPIFDAVGMSVGLLREKDTPTQKRAAYGCDVTYGPGYEFGFDYLRDQLSILHRPTPTLGEGYRKQFRGETPTPIETLQRGHCSAIVDEADSVFIDEANTPLLLSGPSSPTNPHPQIYELATTLVGSFSQGIEFVVDRKTNAPKLTQQGLSLVLKEFDKVADTQLRQAWPAYVEQAIVATMHLAKDVQYVIEDDKVKIVDNLTGRIFTDRTWRAGLHQMVEAKEGVPITAESNPLARISRQQYFQLYDRLCGMTGTAKGSENELSHFYKLDVEAIPSHKPCIRKVFPTRVLATADRKWEVISNEIARIHKTGRPVLVGTRTIESSQQLAQRLQQKRLSFQLLNGIQDATEAEIVARAGQLSAITVSTNMAGRGTDIGLDADVALLGGLHVIVTEPHESRRVDRQLIGRAARQGAPGSCQTFASADDELFSQHAQWFAEHVRSEAGADGEVTEDLTKTIQTIQTKIERSNYTRRRQLFARDAWLEDVMATVAGDRSF